MEADDILTENTTAKEDIRISDGDFVVNKSDQQHIQHILKADKGQYYQHPLVGLGIRNFQAASINPDELKQQIKTQLKADNYDTEEIQVSDKFIVNIDAKRLK